MAIAENIAIIEEKIQKACIKAGRKREDITLMGVSKFVPVEKIKEAFDAGVRCFGESRVKEGVEKFAALKREQPGVQVHMIGTLQRNKAKDAVLFYDCIQSADRLELIEELAKHLALCENEAAVLLEMRTGEETKSGFESLDELFKAAELVLSRDKLKVTGLMTMAPFTTDENLIRSSFRRLAGAKAELEKRFPSGQSGACWDVLSMGMSNDFEIAIEEGATLLRIGGAIFKG